jgi:Tol biopolymer transport system component
MMGMEGKSDIFLIDTNGGNPRRLTKGHGNEASPTWSPDGAFIVYSSDRTGVSNLYAYAIGDGRTYQITNLVGGAFESSVSPDGKEIAFTGYSADGFDIYLTEFAPQNGWEVGPLNEQKMLQIRN